MADKDVYDQVLYIVHHWEIYRIVEVNSKTNKHTAQRSNCRIEPGQIGPSRSLKD